MTPAERYEEMLQRPQEPLGRKVGPTLLMLGLLCIGFWYALGHWKTSHEASATFAPERWQQVQIGSDFSEAVALLGEPLFSGKIDDETTVHCFQRAASPTGEELWLLLVNQDGAIAEKVSGAPGL